MLFFVATFSSILANNFQTGTYLIKFADDPKLHVTLNSSSTARLKDVRDGILPPNTEEVAEIVPAGSKFYINFKDKHLCSKKVGSGVIGCSGYTTFDDSQWTIEETPNGVHLLSSGRCLTKGGLDTRKDTEGFYLKVEKCDSESPNQLFTLEKVYATKAMPDLPMFKNVFENGMGGYGGTNGYKSYSSSSYSRSSSNTVPTFYSSSSYNM